MSEQRDPTEDKHPPYTMWNCPPEERVNAYSDINLTPELIASLDDVPTPDREYVERQTAAFNVPLAPGTLDIIVHAHV